MTTLCIRYPSGQRRYVDIKANSRAAIARSAKSKLKAEGAVEVECRSCRGPIVLRKVVLTVSR